MGASTNAMDGKTKRGKEEQGRIHGSPVADGWARAVMRKPLGIQKCDGPTDRPTDQHGKVLSRVSATKNAKRDNRVFRANGADLS